MAARCAPRRDPRAGPSKRRVEQREQRPEGVLVAAVRGRGDEDQVPVWVAAELWQQLVALLAAAVVAEREAVGLVDDHELRAGADEVVAVTLGLDEVGRDDHVVVALEERLADPEAALQPACGRGEHELGVDVELVAQLGLPLLGEVRRAEHREPLRVPWSSSSRAISAGLDRLADPDVVGDQQPDGVQLERHQQRHELVGARLDADVAE